MTQQLLGLILIILLVGILLAALVLPFFYLRYIDRLEKSGDCSCSEGFNRNFIKFYSAFVYVSIIVLILSFNIKCLTINLKAIIDYIVQTSKVDFNFYDKYICTKKPKTNLVCLLFCFPQQTKQIPLFIFLENLGRAQTAFGFI